MHQSGRERIEEMHVVDCQNDRFAFRSANQMASDDGQKVDPVDSPEVFWQQVSEGAKREASGGLGSRDELDVMVGLLLDHLSQEAGLADPSSTGDQYACLKRIVDRRLQVRPFLSPASHGPPLHGEQSGLESAGNSVLGT